MLLYGKATYILNGPLMSACKDLENTDKYETNSKVLKRFHIELY